MRVKSSCLLFLVFFPFSWGLAQLTNELESLNTDYSIGISSRRFVNTLFKEASFAPELLYTFQKGSSTRFRVGGTIELKTGKGERNVYAFSVGAHHIFKRAEKWEFYYGSDLFYHFSNIRSEPETNHIFGLLPFMGIAYQLSKHFVISTEPGLFFIYRMKKDPDAFSVVKDTQEIGMLNIGHIRIDFRF